tara:strand:+ start:616 stop:2820 length:2205 start_codon:yes stop_codon:yes gene_type:complete
MPLNLASPGIVVREVDLTIGRVDSTSGSVGALVAPFEKGPIGDPQLIESEEDLLQTFGKPYSTDKHFEHWMVASSFLAYGGTMQIVRADDQTIRNATDDGDDIKIKGGEHYQQLGYDESTLATTIISAKNPGTWANGIKIAIIDGLADQVLGVTTTNSSDGITIGSIVTQDVPVGAVEVGNGVTTPLDGQFKGTVTDIGTGTISVKLTHHVSAAGIVRVKDYSDSGVFRFGTVKNLGITTAGQSTEWTSSLDVTGASDWFEAQNINITGGSIIEWDAVASKPGTSAYAAERGARFDEVHIVVIDDLGQVTGNAGTILEKHLSLSKAKDAEYSVGSSSYWRKYLEINSNYVFGLSAPKKVVGQSAVGLATVSHSGASNNYDLDTNWDQDANSIIFAGSGNNQLTLQGGKNYGGLTDVTSVGALNSGLDDIISGLTLFENKENIEVDFILQGSGSYSEFECAALANKCIAVAEARKDAVAFVSPYRTAFINDNANSSTNTDAVNDIDTITEKVKGFAGNLTSTTYGVIDSGYKYMYDRFNNTFRYVPLNGDIAGTCARTSIEQFPWFSPAGTARGAILNAVKLVYNPGQKQRDILYTNRVNPVINSPGAGIVLFGDKTAFGKSSAFDRINVRRLFIYLEDAISAAAKDQLFEFNDEITRTNFVNIIEPFLRDVQSKRGIFDFVVICDETNNTAAVIDSNELVADIFIKPARSINFIGLTFVATRTGVAFEEVIGSV